MRSLMRPWAYINRRLDTKRMEDVNEYESNFSLERSYIERSKLLFTLRENVTQPVTLEEINTEMQRVFGKTIAPIHGTQTLFYCDTYVYRFEVSDGELRGQRTRLPYHPADNPPRFGQRNPTMQQAQDQVMALTRLMLNDDILTEEMRNMLEDDFDELLFDLIVFKTDAFFDPYPFFGAAHRFLPPYALHDMLSVQAQARMVQIGFNSIHEDEPIRTVLQKHGDFDIYTDTDGAILEVTFTQNWFEARINRYPGTSAREFVDTIKRGWRNSSREFITIIANQLCQTQVRFEAARDSRYRDDSTGIELHDIETRALIYPPAHERLHWKMPKSKLRTLIRRIADAMLRGQTNQNPDGITCVRGDSSVQFDTFKKGEFRFTVRNHLQATENHFEAQRRILSGTDTEEASPPPALSRETSRAESH